MAIASPPTRRAQPALSQTLEQRRREVHRECVRSLALNNPKAIAELLSHWLRQDPRR